MKAAAAPAGERRALLFVFVTVLIDAIGFGVVIPVFPGLIVQWTGRSLAGAAEIAGWISFLYAAVQFLCGPVIGGLSDRFGRRPVLLASLFAFGVDYLVMAMAPNLWWLVATRVIAGVTGATFPTAYAYIADISTPERRSANFGIIGMAFGFGFIIGPALGGIVAQFGDRVPFLVAGGLAFANAAYGWLVLPESLAPANRRPFDIRRANPIGALSRLRSAHPRVLLLAITVFIWAMSYQSLYSVWSFFGIERFGWTPAQVGWSLAAVGVSGALVQGVLSRRLIPRFGQRNIIIAGALSGMAGYTLYAFAWSGWVVYVGIAVAALQGLVFPCLQGLMSADVSAREQGELQGAITSIQALSAIMGPPLMTSTFAWFSGGGSQIYFPGAPFLLSTAFAGLALAMFFQAVARGAGRPAEA
ncbi:MFS transporter [Polymorphobacter fuscus]|uniref:MFS transporter n=1 Tax=Sandarakinorhabdus fusca TaxID=1439888 RepID=A0A7C9KLS4_9SPHN|nr:TCR/Tet family MFS transporter [Polymorphobacter fuscus]KAB7646572.1 TCR/Tet family MFS transporter [Polymorphobacter fuscus]MQT17343.1 MFS transporter [Polymorphobacter fuscus]